MPLLTELPQSPLHQAAHEVTSLLDHGAQRTHTLLIRADDEHEKGHWRNPILIALTLNVALLLGGFVSRHDTLLEMIRNGETLAIAPVDPALQDSKPLEVELTPPPPPEANPEFVKPEEKPKVAEVIKPKVQPKPVVTEAPRTNERNMLYAASGAIMGDKNCPRPPYPYDARVKRFQGTVVLTISVVDGVAQSVEVASSSGYGVLDSATSAWIRQKWKFPEGLTRTFSLPVKYNLTEGVTSA